MLNVALQKMGSVQWDLEVLGLFAHSSLSTF